MKKRPIVSGMLFRPNNILTESVGDRDVVVVRGVIQRKDRKNQNGRIYPGHILEREVDKYQEKVRTRRAVGELDHPESNTVNYRNTSHIISKLWWEGNDLMADIEILDTPSGRILKTLLEANVTVGISSRGMGSVQAIDETTVEVQDDFEFICWDFVSDPSTHGAFMKPVTESINESKGIVNESRESKISALLTEIICDISGKCSIKGN